MALSVMKQDFCRPADNGRALPRCGWTGSFRRRSKSHQAHAVSKEDTMLRKMAIALAAVVVVTAGSTLSAAARGGGHGGMGHGGMGHGGMGSGGFGHAGGFGGAAMAHPGGFGGVAAVHPMALRGGRFVSGDRFHFRHRFVGNRFAFVGGGLPYGYYDDCYTRVWTPWGWRWSYVCY
jgi:hypothetical protein